MRLCDLEDFLQIHWTEAQIAAAREDSEVRHQVAGLFALAFLDASLPGDLFTMREIRRGTNEQAKYFFGKDGIAAGTMATALAPLCDNGLVCGTESITLDNGVVVVSSTYMITSAGRSHLLNERIPLPDN